MFRVAGTRIGNLEDITLQFLLPRVVTENIMRHGFAPETTPRYREEFVSRWSKAPMSSSLANGQS